MYLMLCAVILLSIFILAILLWYAVYYYFVAYMPLTCAKMKPILGIANNLSKLDDFLNMEMDLFENKTKTLKGLFGYFPLIAIKEVDFLEYISSSNKLISKSYIYTFLEGWLGKGLLTSAGRKWKTKRKLLTPAYHFKILDNFINVFEYNADILVKQLDKEIGKDFDIYTYITLCSLDIICETAMGTKVDAQLNEDSFYVLANKEVTRCISERIYTPLQHIPIYFYLSSNYRKLTKNIKILHDFRTSVIKERIASIKNEKPNANEENDFGIKKRKVFLDILLQSTIDNKTLTIEEINEEVDTFMFEGHDTVSAALGFAFYSISNNPSVQRKIVEEQNLIFGDDKSRKITYNDLQEMKYLEMVIKETLRLYPSVPFYGRAAEEDIQYKDIYIKKGMQFQLFIFGMQRDADYYPEPDTFDPNRFSYENQKSSHPFSFLSFSAGPRNCIGQKFAMLEMKAVISKVIRHYKLLPLVPMHKVKLVAELILKAKNGIRLRIEKR